MGKNERRVAVQVNGPFQYLDGPKLQLPCLKLADLILLRSKHTLGGDKGVVIGVNG